MSEFDLIKRLQEKICLPEDANAPPCQVGIGDDAAVLQVPADRELVICTDTLVRGVHFLPETSAESIGHKSLAVNLSDLAAMGAEPAWFFLALTMPSSSPGWLESFANGMSRLARHASIQLAGGDMTSGPLSVTVTALGLVEPGTALLRSGARPGDLIAVSGRPGAAAHALSRLKRGQEPEPMSLEALNFPDPRLEVGRLIRTFATACIDLSDGLAADLGHLLEQSDAGGVIDLEKIPRAACLEGHSAEQSWPFQLAGGDDYELCFTIPPDSVDRLSGLVHITGLELTVIGELTAGNRLITKYCGTEVHVPGPAGYQHFGNGS